MATDYYQALGVAETATQDEIKNKFRSMAKKYHPDRNPGNKAAEAKFKELSEAYETLSDPAKRQEYDNMRKYGAFSGGSGHGDPHTYEWKGNFEDLFGRRTGGQGHRGGAEDIGDILSGLFGGRGESFEDGFGQPQQRLRKGADLQAELTVSFMEMAHGSSRVIEFQGGKKLNVKIPIGIEDGAQLRLNGQGQPARGNSPAGDLLLTVHVMPDPHFSRKGNDVYASVEVPFTVAILGGKAQVHTLDKSVTLTIPAGTQPGAQLRLKGQGLKTTNGTGDLYVEVKVRIPTTLTEKQKKMMEEWGG